MDGERRASSAFALGAATALGASVVFGAILVVVWSSDDVHRTVTSRLWVGVQLAWPAVAAVAMAWLVAGLVELRRSAGPAALVAAGGFAAIGVLLVVNVWFQVWWIPTRDELDPDTMRSFYEWTSRLRCAAAVVAAGGLFALDWPRLEAPHFGALLLAPLVYPSPAIADRLEDVLGQGWTWASYGGRVALTAAFLACAVLVVRAAPRPAQAEAGARGAALRGAALGLGVLGAVLIAAAAFLGIAFEDRDHAAVRVWPYVYPLLIALAVGRVFTGLVRAAFAPAPGTPERRLLLAAGAILAGIAIELERGIGGYHVAREVHAVTNVYLADILGVAAPAAILAGLLGATSAFARLAVDGGARTTQRLALPVAIAATALTAGAVALRRVVFDALVSGEQGAGPAFAVFASTVLQGAALAAVGWLGLRVAADLRGAALPTAELRR